MMEKEVWTKIKTNRHDYEVSNFGRVRRIMPNGIFKIMKQTPFKDKEYLSVSLPIDEKNPNNQLCGYKRKRVHVLVALAFIPNPHNKPTVNHKDGNKQNNHHSNLEWATNQEQTDHAITVIETNNTLELRKLNKRQVFAILNSPLGDVELAAKYKVRKSVIYNLRKGKCYKEYRTEFLEQKQGIIKRVPEKKKITLIEVKKAVIKDYRKIINKRKKNIKTYGDIDKLCKKHNISETNLHRIIKST